MKKSLIALILLTLIASCTAKDPSNLTASMSDQNTAKKHTEGSHSFSTISNAGTVTVTLNDIELVEVSATELAENYGIGGVNSTTYILSSTTDTDGCGPSRLEMINAAKDETYKQEAPWNKTGTLLLVESGFNAMRWQNGVCETIKNPKSGATCMGQFLYSYHKQRDWARIENREGDYNNHLWCLNQAITYLIEEANLGLGANAYAWEGWDPYWDGAVWRYKGCWHPAAQRSNGTTDCDIFRGAELAGGFVDEASNVYVSLQPQAINECWNFDTNTWDQIDRSTGENCLDFNNLAKS